MKFINVRQTSVLVQLYVNWRPGPAKMVMRDIVEEVFGPSFMKGADGRDIHMTVSGEMIVADVGGPVAANVICVTMTPVRKDWTDADGVRYSVVVQDYRYQPRERQSR